MSTRTVLLAVVIAAAAWAGAIVGGLALIEWMQTWPTD